LQIDTAIGFLADSFARTFRGWVTGRLLANFSLNSGEDCANALLDNNEPDSAPAVSVAA